MNTVHLLLLLCAVSMVALVAAENRSAPVAKMVSKSAAALLFVAAGFVATPHLDGAAAFLLAALVLSAVGDLLLLPKGAGVAFVGGLLSFLLAHLMYVAALVAADASILYAGLMLVVFVPVAFFILRWLWPNLSKRMRVPVVAYVVVITSMTCMAAGFFAEHVTLGSFVALVAAVMFFLSDICVARERFVTPAFLNKAVGLPLYFGAQIVWVLWLFYFVS